MTCSACMDGNAIDFAFSMAFQPIVETRSGKTFAYEALVRGSDGSGAASVLSLVDARNRYAFDQECRVRAIELAANVFPNDTPFLSINFMPNAVYEPRACIRRTLDAAKRSQFPLDKIIFEFTETEYLDTSHLLHILHVYRQIGFKTAIDDFGAGFSGLSLLTRFQPDIVKLDMELIRGIEADPVKKVVVQRTLEMLRDLGITSVCEGVETRDELTTLTDLGADLVQGYYIGRPTFEAV